MISFNWESLEKFKAKNKLIYRAEYTSELAPNGSWTLTSIGVVPCRQENGSGDERLMETNDST